MLRLIRNVWVVLWASPWSFVGVLLGLLAILTGGGYQRVGMVLEFHGGWLVRVFGANAHLRWSDGHDAGAYRRCQIPSGCSNLSRARKGPRPAI